MCKRLLVGLIGFLWLIAWLPVAAWLWPEATWIRLDLASRGMVFVRVVDQSKIDVFKYTHESNLRLRSLVFWRGKLVGYSIWPLGWYPYFVPASGRITWNEPGFGAFDWREKFALLYWPEGPRAIFEWTGKVNIVLLPSALVLGVMRFSRARISKSASAVATPGTT